MLPLFVGVVYERGDSESQLVMKGVVRAEKLLQPEHYIADILAKAGRDVIVSSICQYLQHRWSTKFKQNDFYLCQSRTYEVYEWKDEFDFMEMVAAKKGRLLKVNNHSL